MSLKGHTSRIYTPNKVESYHSTQDMFYKKFKITVISFLSNYLELSSLLFEVFVQIS